MKRILNFLAILFFNLPAFWHHTRNINAPIVTIHISNNRKLIEDVERSIMRLAIKHKENVHTNSMNVKFDTFGVDIERWRDLNQKL